MQNIWSFEGPAGNQASADGQMDCSQVYRDAYALNIFRPPGSISASLGPPGPSPWLPWPPARCPVIWGDACVVLGGASLEEKGNPPRARLSSFSCLHSQLPWGAWAHLGVRGALGRGWAGD